MPVFLRVLRSVSTAFGQCSRAVASLTLLWFTNGAIAPAPAYADVCEVLPALIKLINESERRRMVQPLRCTSLSYGAFFDYSEAMMQREVSTQRLMLEERVYQAFGIVPRTFRFDKDLLHIYTTNSTGFYDSSVDSIFLADWVDPLEALNTLVHEMRHALQDSIVPLELFRDQNLTSDELMARSAVLEGDAQLFERRISRLARFSYIGDAVRARYPKAMDSRQNSPQLSVPQALEALLAFPYAAGLRFVEDAPPLGDLLRRPPRSTAEVLGMPHGPLRVSSYSTNDEQTTDRLGAAFLEAFVSHWLNDKAGKSARLMWRDDDLRIENNELRWRIRCATDARCRSLAKLLAQALSERLNGTVYQNLANAYVVQLRSVAARVFVVGNEVTLRFFDQAV